MVAEHAHIPLAAGDDDGINSGPAQLLVQVGPGPRRVNMLVKNSGWWNELREFWDKPDHFRPELVDGHRSPALVIMPPHPDAVARFCGRDEARKNGSLRMSGRDGNDIWQHARQPRHFPFGASANILCMSTQMWTAFSPGAP
jgi:hypothetical protein